MLVRVNKDKGIELLVSRPHLLYGLFCLASEEWKNRDAGEFTNGKIAVPAFPEMRPAYDHLPHPACPDRSRLQPRRAFQENGETRVLTRRKSTGWHSRFHLKPDRKGSFCIGSTPIARRWISS